MNQLEVAVQHLKEIIKRRKRILIIIPILMLMIGIGASYLIPPKYHSSISILVQKEETLNPLILYEMAVNIASEDRLKSFNEIIYSRSTIEMLIDTLNLDQDIKTNMEKQTLINEIKTNIGTSLRASDSFDIVYFDSDPHRAQEGVGILANYFIKKRLNLENARNEQTVEFFEEKLTELELAVDQRRENILTLTQQRLEESPNDNTALNFQMQSLDREIDALSQKVNELTRVKDDLTSVNYTALAPADIDQLYNISLMNLPFMADLRSKLRDYDAQKQRYTREHPTMKLLIQQIGELVERIPPAVQSELDFAVTRKQDLEDQRQMIIGSMQETVAANRIDETVESDYGIYRKLYDEMKVKLEQAKTTRDLGRKAADQFIVIDPPYFPEKPSTPNRPLIIAGSLLVGMFLALVTVVAAEIFDSTVRREEDILQWDKPIIAFITDGKSV